MGRGPGDRPLYQLASFMNESHRTVIQVLLRRLANGLVCAGMRLGQLLMQNAGQYSVQINTSWLDFQNLTRTGYYFGVDCAACQAAVARRIRFGCSTPSWGECPNGAAGGTSNQGVL